MTDLTLAGVTAGQPTAETSSVSPFAGVSVTSTAAATPETTVVVTLSTAADGALSHLGVGALSADGSTYTVSGSPALVQAALRGLVFTPTLHQVAVGQSVTTGFALYVSDAAGAVTNTTTSVVATAADTAPTITDTSAAHAPTSSNPMLTSPQGTTSFTPFAYTTVADPDAGASETTTLTLAQNGAATDTVGVLSGAGLTKTGVGTYVLAAASPAAESAALQALRFSPTTLPASSTVYAGASLDVTLSVSDGFAAPATAGSTLQLTQNPGTPTVDTFSTSSTTTYNDTASAQTTPTYSTTVEAVLNGTTVLYEQTFALPSSDPQVQAAETQAQTALRNAGATPGAPVQATSNTTTLSSQTSTAQTGSTHTTSTQVTTAFGPSFVGPRVSDPIPSNYTGYFYAEPGQLDVNTNNETDTTVSRAVTTTSTTLLSQKYIISGSTMAAAASNLALVSSSAAGVDGNAASADNTVIGGITANGTTVLFSSVATNLSPADTNSTDDLFLKNTATGAVTLVTTNGAGVRPNADTFYGSVDGDGNLVAFSTTATNLDARAADGNSHLYLRNVSAGTLTLVAPADYTIRNGQTGAVEAASNFTNLTAPSLSGDGRYVAAQGNAGGSTAEIVLFDTVNHTATDLTGLNFVGSHAAVSQDGATVVFHTTAPLQPVGTLPLDIDTVRDVYAYSIATGGYTLVSDSSGVNAPAVKGNGDSVNPTVSNDGTRVAFQSAATNLDSRDTDGAFDVYVKDLTTGRLFLADVTADGSTKANAAATNAYISGDGTMVTFTSAATNLVAGVTDGLAHVYLKTLSTGAISVLDQTPAGAAGNGAAVGAAIFAPDSAHVAFTSSASNLVANDTNGQSDVFLAGVTATPPAATPPTITGVPATETDPGRAAFNPFANAVVTGTATGQTYTVSLQADVFGTQQAGGTFSGGGFTAVGADGATFSSTSLAAVQAALRAVSFTPNSADTSLAYNITAPAGVNSAYSLEILAPPATPVNTPPTIGGTQAGQADAAGVAISPFSTVTVADPDAGQSETVSVEFTAANGTLSGGGFVQTAPGVYSVMEAAGGAGASAAAAQAALRVATFTPTAGQSATTTFTISVNDGQATATNGTTSVVATYTPPPPVMGGGGGSGGGAVASTPASVQAGLSVEFQNLSRSLAQGADALTPGTPLYAQWQAEHAVADQLDHDQITLPQAEAALAHLVDGTTAVAVSTYAFFTGFTPTATGLDYLVHSQANATDLNDAYYARFTTENRYINFAVNLATGPGAGAAAFGANYGSLSLADATAKAYAAVFGITADAAKVSAILTALVPDGLGGQETRATYFAQYGGDGANGQGTKAAMVGFLLSQAVHDGSGVYGAATEHYLAALAHGTAPAIGSELALTYGPAISLVGVTPVADATVTG